MYTGVTYVKLKIIAPVIGTNGEKEYKILKFSAYYETAKFLEDQSEHLLLIGLKTVSSVSNIRHYVLICIKEKFTVQRLGWSK